jgi:hypothetical protein
VYQVQRVAVAAQLRFGPVARFGVSDDQRREPIRSHGHAFDPIRRLDALDQRRLAQRAKHLR